MFPYEQNGLHSGTLPWHSLQQERVETTFYLLTRDLRYMVRDTVLDALTQR